jgi:hypothetical protein
MRAVLGSIVIAAAICFAGSAGAVAPQTSSGAVTAVPHANATVVAQRCRCLERRWNGSCKLRVCRNHW